MAYRIKQFDGLVLTDITYLSQNGSNDLGAGDALTSFAQLPGGGFFDNYGENDAPQGIRPLIRNCVLWGDTQAELVTNLKAIRSKIGRRGKLAIQFDTGEIWWQWARLRRCHTPRPLEAVGNFLPCNLMFETASQVWYGVIQGGDTWSVGDDSFYLGDGSVSLGMNEYTYDLDTVTDTINVTLPNDGNTFVRNMRMTLATDARLDEIVIRCPARGQDIRWANPGLAGAFTLTIDTGAKSCLIRMDDEGIENSAAVGRGSTIRFVTAGPHGWSSGDSVEVRGSTIYDGVYHNITVDDTVSFIVDMVETVDQDRSSDTAGSIYPLVDGWTDLTVYDRKNWFTLFPGDNDLTITHTLTAGTPLQEYSIQFSWYDHYK